MVVFILYHNKLIIIYELKEISVDFSHAEFRMTRLWGRVDMRKFQNRHRFYPNLKNIKYISRYTKSTEMFNTIYQILIIF